MMLQQQIEKLLQQKAGAAAVNGLHLAYQHEQPWGVPCSLDLFHQEGTGKRTRRYPPTEAIGREVARIVDIVVAPRSGIILAGDGHSLTIMWRLTVEQKPEKGGVA